MISPTETSARKSRAQIWLLVAVFFAPLLIAFLLYYGFEGWRPAGRTNHGDLIDPPRSLPPVQLTSANGAPLDPELMRGKWSLVYIGAGSCAARCKEALTQIRQTRLALNDDLPRVQRVFLATGPCCDRSYLDAEHAGLIVAAAGAAGHTLIEQFPDPASGRIYIVDPLGNLMMSYAADAPPRGLLEDLKKLLKLSHIG
jgi:cytochrome oxidase Cu insertion factor (SCO1/SenC/PrrC family)